MRAWIDRTNGGLSGMPTDGISLRPKRTSARPAERYATGQKSMTACGTKLPIRNVCYRSANRGRAASICSR